MVGDLTSMQALGERAAPQLQDLDLTHQPRANEPHIKRDQAIQDGVNRVRVMVTAGLGQQKAGAASGLHVGM